MSCSPKGSKSNSLRLPAWLKVHLPSDDGELTRVARTLREQGLKTVCTGAKCPNRAECWARGTATVMILGADCTRGCRFCAVNTSASPAAPDPSEPLRVARLVAQLELRYVVVTSVTRDDLGDGGAGQFADTVARIREHCPETRVELLIPDLAGDPRLLDVILAARPDVVGHNLETVRRLTATVRDPRTDYDRSLQVLGYLADRAAAVKTSLLLGLGEVEEEVLATLNEAFEAGVRHVALGQYLRPSPHHAPVERYWTPEEFARFEDAARRIGFASVAAGPLVRASYRAEEFAGSIPGHP